MAPHPRREGRCDTEYSPPPKRGSTYRTQDRTSLNIPATWSPSELHSHEIERRPWAADVELEGGVLRPQLIDTPGEVVPQLLLHQEGRTEHDAGQMFSCKG